MSATLAPRRRLVVPARRHEAREEIFAGAPFFLRGGATPEPAPPPLLSFEGADFLTGFLASVADRARLPRLLPWRDWAEPPAGVLDAAGRPRYPATLRRAKPLAIEPEAGTEEDGVPAGSPAWLRKLYLPLHGRFNLVAFDLTCRRAYMPPVDRARLLGAGAVIRRLRPDPLVPHWEDWISADGRSGVWIRLAQPIEQMDPEALPAAAFAGQDVALRARLGLPAEAPLPAALDSARLSPLPPDAAGRHCTLYGYVPVFSSAEQAQDLPPATPAEMVAALQARATAAADAAAGAAPTLAARIRSALATLLAETVLPPRPASGALGPAWAAVQGFVSATAAIPGGNAVAASALSLDRMARSLLIAGFDALDHAGTNTAALGGAAPETASGWLGRAHGRMDGMAGGAQKAERFGSNWGAENWLAHRGSWTTLLAERLHQLASAVLDGAAIPPPRPGQPAALDAQDGALLLADALLRLRVLRMALAASLRKQMFKDAADTEGLKAERDGLPLHTPGALGAEIAAALGLEAWRGTPETPAWPPLDAALPAGSGNLAAHRAHQAASALEAVHAEFEAALAAAGTAFDQEQEAALAARAQALGGRLRNPADPAVLRRHGLELREQPARGLLGLPGATPSTASLQALGPKMAGHYADQGKALAVARAEARVPRLRYDHDSLYAVWCWARVAGRDACEAPRLVWTRATEPFSIAEPTDVLGARPAQIQLPDIPRLIRDIPRIAKARARPFAAFAAPPDSSYVTGDEPEDTRRAWGIGWICSFGIPVLTICAFILFSIIFAILITLPGFLWMLLLRFCIPVPKRSS